MISNIHYITQGNTSKAHLDCIKNICNAGANWIQLRMKNMFADEYLKTAIKAKKICDKYHAQLIVNDHPYIAKEINAAGVHLGQQDIDISKARNIIGKHKIIGGTANNFIQVKKLYQKGVNYIGLGPFKFTQTKKNLSPIIGLQGYQNIIEQCKKQQIHIPIIAIGGITTEDISSLIKCGIYGVAISSLLTFAQNQKELFNTLKREIENAPNSR